MFPARADSPPVLVGKSSRIRQVLHVIQKLGKSRSPVLILGETGTGKEVVARAIHAVASAGPFVPIDCSALVGPLMESELFGHTRGAFTGAAGSKKGLVESAEGGTAFFDEIGELPLDFQAKLLRLIQEKEYRPVGSVEWRKANFRILAATNRDLAREVERGAFRRDLFYRLNVITLRMPALRDRKEDIQPLAEHFLEERGTRHLLTRECLDALLAYDWPGNVRELENAVERMVAMNSGPLLHTADLPSSLQNDIDARNAAQCFATAAAAHALRGNPASVSVPEHSTLGSLPSLTEVERTAIIRAIEYTKGDRVMAAHLLGIGRTTLYRKLKEYRLTD
jgi:DNA-binding NtrC family response regulator